MQTAIDELKKLTSGSIHIGLNSNDYAASPLYKLKGATHHVFDGPHPAGNVGIQIHHVSPIKKGEIVWTINAIDLTAIGKLFQKGIYDLSRTIAIAGPQEKRPCYVKSLPGMPVKEILYIVETQ